MGASLVREHCGAFRRRLVMSIPYQTCRRSATGNRHSKGFAQPSKLTPALHVAPGFDAGASIAAGRGANPQVKGFLGPEPHIAPKPLRGAVAGRGCPPWGWGGPASKLLSKLGRRWSSLVAAPSHRHHVMPTCRAERRVVPHDDDLATAPAAGMLLAPRTRTRTPHGTTSLDDVVIQL